MTVSKNIRTSSTDMHEFSDSAVAPIMGTMSALMGLAAPWWTELLSDFHGDLPFMLQIGGFILIVVQIKYYWKRGK